MSKYLCAGVLSALALAATAAAADAAVVTVRFTGEINLVSGGYYVDPFGAPDVAGPLATPLEYVYDLTFDTSVGTYTVGAGIDFLHSVPQNSPANRTWSLTINGASDVGSFDAGELYNSQIQRTGSASGGAWSIGFDGGFHPREYYAAVINVSSTAANSQTFADPFVNQHTSGLASFHHYGLNAATGTYTSLYILSGTVDGVEVLQPGAAVPEPATWAMMVGGFIAMGGILRRGRRPVRA